MIFLTPNNEYPRLDALIHGPIRHLEGRDPKVFRAFRAYCGSVHYARAALFPGKGPVVALRKLVDRNGHEAHNVPGQYPGMCVPKGHARRNMIEIQLSRVESFEQGEITAREMESILLHECVHWARFFVFEGTHDEVGDMEAGSLFEHMAYGKPLTTHADKGCKDGTYGFHDTEPMPV